MSASIDNFSELSLVKVCDKIGIFGVIVLHVIFILCFYHVTSQTTGPQPSLAFIVSSQK